MLTLLQKCDILYIITQQTRQIKSTSDTASKQIVYNPPLLYHLNDAHKEQRAEVHQMIEICIRKFEIKGELGTKSNHSPLKESILARWL